MCNNTSCGLPRNAPDEMIYPRLYHPRTPVEHQEFVLSSLKDSKACLPFYSSYLRCARLAKNRAITRAMEEYGYWRNCSVTAAVWIRALFCWNVTLSSPWIYGISNGSRNALIYVWTFTYPWRNPRGVLLPWIIPS